MGHGKRFERLGEGQHWIGHDERRQVVEIRGLNLIVRVRYSDTPVSVHDTSRLLTYCHRVYQHSSLSAA